MLVNLTNTKKTNINWEKREKELIKLLDKYRSKNGKIMIVLCLAVEEKTAGTPVIF